MRTGYAYPLLCAALVTLVPIVSAHYSLKDTYIGNDFYSGFQWETFDDPTHGRVNYVDQGTAVAKNLTYAHGNTLILRADSTTTLSPSGPGRNSVSIRSKKTYTTHVAMYVPSHVIHPSLVDALDIRRVRLLYLAT